MELYTTLDNVIIHNYEKNECLWCNRIDGQLIPSHGDKLLEAWKPVCKGIVYGVIGKMQLLPGSDWKLLVISGRHFVGYLPGGVEVYNIRKIAVLPLSSDVNEFNDLELESCPRHEVNGETDNFENKSKPQQKVQQTWNNIKSGANNITGKTNVFLKELKEKDKMERRLLEELLKMFNDSGSFYYSPNGDLSNSQQRLQAFHAPYTWKQTDDRFFWNKFMLTELMESTNPSACEWIVPIIQGYVQVERCFIDHLEDLNSHSSDHTDGSNSDDEDEGWDLVDFSSAERYRTAENLKEDEFDLVVISRRSRHQAGTRYKRRGVNDNGHVANYVETEQIACVLTHIVSHVQIRGSVPVYWSQPGVKYRPLPQIDRSLDETKLAFSKHFVEELDKYNQQIIVSLVELNGREKIIADAFMEHIFEYNNEDLIFITFDFHEYCRGMKFENVAILTDVIEHYIHKMGFHWLDDSGTVMQQSSVFRVNCMDCLDRTNVVQAAIARDVLQIILRKLGRLLPDELLTSSCRRIHNYIWANNGDAISRQYAGTAAMKGDFTRTGERKMLGVMKDGYNSANRYYLNRFKDNYRQAVIDMMLGKVVTEDLAAISTASSSTDEEGWTSDKEECITQLVRHSELTLLPRDEECLGGWALVDPFTFVTATDNPQDEDVILMLTHQAYYVARYNDEMEELFSYQRIPLENLEKIEIGLESFHYQNQYIFMRLFYGHNKMSGYFHTMRTIQRRSKDESKGILLSIAEVFLSVCRYQGIDLKVAEGKFDKRRSKAQPNIRPLSSKRTLSTSSRTKVSSDSVSHKTSDHRRSRSLSNIENQNASIPEITIESAEQNEFMEFHQKFSPASSVKTKEIERVKGIPKSASENDMGVYQTKTTEPPKQAAQTKLDSFFQKTKLAWGNVAPKLRDLSPASRKQNPPEKPPITCRDVVPAKTTFQRFNEKFMNRTGTEVKNPLKMLPEFRNKIQTALSSPRSRRKPRVLSDEDIEKRQNCKTKIIEL